MLATLAAVLFSALAWVSTGTSQLAAAVAASTPVLTAGAVSPASATARTPVALKAPVVNKSSAGSGPSAYLFQIDNNSAHGVLYGSSTGNLNSISVGASRYATLTYTFPLAGTWYLRVCPNAPANALDSAITNCGPWSAINVAASGTSSSDSLIGQRIVSCIASGAGITQGAQSAVSVNGDSDMRVDYTGAKTGQTVTWSVRTYIHDADGNHAVVSDPSNWSYTWQSPDMADTAGAPLSVAYATPGTKTLSVVIDGLTYPCGKLTVSGADLSPTASLMAPASIEAGAKGTLSWTSTNARYCTALPSVGAGAKAGSISISPRQSTTYVLSCRAAYAPLSAVATATTTVSVGPSMPSCSLRATVPSTSDTVPVTLSWKTTNVTSISISGGAGSVTPVASGIKTLPAPAGASYTATVTGANGTATCTASTTVFKDPAIGINVNNVPLHSVAAQIQNIDNSGAGTVRIVGRWLQTQNGTIDWTDNDAAVNALSARGIKVLMIIVGTPCWALDDPAAFGINTKTCTGNVHGIPKKSAWQGFLTALAKRYAGKVQYYEIWNEPNTTGSQSLLQVPKAEAKGVPNLTLYSDDILIPAAQAIHAADPSAKVVGPVTVATGATTTTSGQLAHALADGAANLIDIVSLHVYPGKDPAVYGSAVKTGAMTTLGIKDDPLWLTEYSSIFRTTVPISANALAAQVTYFTQQWQQNAKKPVYGAMFWFALNDNGNNPATMNYGLLNYDKSPRPVYTTLQAATQTDGAL